MKPHLIIFGILVFGFIGYNLFAPDQDSRTTTVISIVYSSILFGYIAFLAFTVLKKMKK
ncbi:hypothetical protein [Chryseobacterium sp.]|uniref:hypothetical protein n=1 Tax=Chryseobacterium sp. TaxID=1871047 RepID=UPI0028A012D7|nr:hypothetical protein [Chryseobacterium sp.]